MATNLDLVASIVANPAAHAVNREKKMDATIDVMCKNLEVRHSMKLEVALPLNESEVRGYGTGTGRKTGD